MPLPRGCGHSREFDQRFRVQVLDRYNVLAGVVRREFVEEVVALAGQVSVPPGDDLTLVCPVVRAVFFP